MLYNIHLLQIHLHLFAIVLFLKLKPFIFVSLWGWGTKHLKVSFPQKGQGPAFISEKKIEYLVPAFSTVSVIMAEK